MAVTKPKPKPKPKPKVAPKPKAKARAMTFSQVEDTWIKAGGNPQAAAMAAAVADASSGLNPNASYKNPDGSVGVGLWLIDQKGVPPGSTDPLANARAAIQQSKNGQDWKQWCVAWSDNNCGTQGGTYLGDGSNALASLAQKLGPSSYNVIGAAAAGDGTSASANYPNSTVQPTGGGLGSKVLFIGAILVVGLLIFFQVRRQRQEGGTTVDTTVAE